MDERRRSERRSNWADALITEAIAQFDPLLLDLDGLLVEIGDTDAWTDDGADHAASRLRQILADHRARMACHADRAEGRQHADRGTGS